MHQFSNPPGGKLRLVEQSDSLLVISIPPGGKKARGIGCFALMWNLITIPISLVFLLVDDANWEGGQAPPLWGMLLFFGVFYAVGIGMLIAWVRMRFMQVLLAVEPGRLTIQRTLFGRKKLKRCELTADSRARLVEAYRSNEVPVYTVQVNTADGQEKFATALTADEKQWIVDTVNQFLGHEPRRSRRRSGSRWPTVCEECGGELLTGEAKRVCAECGKIYTEDDPGISGGDVDSDDGESDWDGDDEDVDVEITACPEPLVPYELPPDSRITIERDEPECLQFSYRVTLPLIIRVLAGGFLLFFCSIWYGVVFSFLFEIFTDPRMGHERWLFAAFLSLFLGAGLMPLGMLLALFFGRVRVQVTPENLTASIGIGPLRKKKSMACSLIRNVGTGPVGTSSSSGLGRTRTSILHGALVRSTGLTLPLSVSSDDAFNREIAGLVRYQLNQHGHLSSHD